MKVSVLECIKILKRLPKNIWLLPRTVCGRTTANGGWRTPQVKAQSMHLNLRGPPGRDVIDLQRVDSLIDSHPYWPYIDSEILSVPEPILICVFMSRWKSRSVLLEKNFDGLFLLIQATQQLQGAFLPSQAKVRQNGHSKATCAAVRPLKMSFKVPFHP